MILNKRGGWHLVQMPDSYIGWVRNTLVELTDDEMVAWKGSDRVIYLGHTGVITDSRGETVIRPYIRGYPCQNRIDG